MRRIVGVGAALLLGGLLGLAFGGARPASAPGAVEAAPAPPRAAPAADRRLIFGINPALARWYSDTKKDRDWERRMLDRIDEACGTIMRTGFDWAQIEPDPPVRGVHTYRWADFDHIVDEASARGLSVVALIVTTPAWANGGQPEDEVHLHPPAEEHTQDFVDFVRALAGRYRGRIGHYEFWNEANSCGWEPACTGDKIEKARGYLPWLKLTYENIKEIDPAAQVSTAGLDLTDWEYLGYLDALYEYSVRRPDCDQRPCREGENFATAYACQGRPCWDAVAVHPYNEFGAIDFDRIDAVHRHMAGHGDHGVPVWITEYGWASVERHPAYLQDSLDRLLTPEYAYITIANYVVIADGPNVRGHGLVDDELNPKTAFYTFSGAACGDRRGVR